MVIKVQKSVEHYRNGISYRQLRPIAKKNSQDKCLPRENTREITPLMIKTVAIISKILCGSYLGLNITKSMAAKPYQARVVICQANLSVLLVNQSLPIKWGRLSRRKSLISMYFSPRMEWIKPIRISNRLPISNMMSSGVRATG